MKSLLALVFIVFSMTTASCVNRQLSSTDNTPSCQDVDDVLANISSINGAEVTVCGWLRYEPEDKNLHASASGRLAKSENHCLSLGRLVGFTADLSSLNGRKVRVAGTATASFCPTDSICMASCSDSGIFVRSVDLLQ
jgi:hypothetical protein